MTSTAGHEPSTTQTRQPALDVGTLRREIRQTKPFASVGLEAVLGLLHTADRVRRFLARTLHGHGVTQQQYNVLRILRGAGEEGLATLAITERMLEQTPGITRLLDRLERKELVRRERSIEDRRQVRCFVTDSGLELLAALEEPMRLADQAAIRGLSEEQQRTLILLMDQLRAGVPDGSG